jgi:putative ABC transport system permease protein
VALSLMLLVAAAMFFRSFRAVVAGSPGFRTDHLLMMGFDPSLARYKPEQTREFYRALSERALRIPGVVNASLSQVVPMGTSFAPRRIVPEGFQFAPGQDRADVFSSVVDERYFDTLATPILRGRAFQAADDASRPRVAVVNQALAEKYWPGRDAVGKRFRLEGPEGPWVEVAGVAKTAKHIFIGESPQPVFYLPLAQNPQSRMTLFLQSAGDPGSLTEPLRQVVRSIDPHQPVYDVRTMGDFYQQRALGTMEVIVVLFASIGLMGLALALVGLYGLMAYTVSRRTREIGIRMAVGAGQGQIIGMVVRQGFWLAAAGVVAGLAGSVAVVRIIVSVFSEMRGAETSTFVLAPLALLAAATAASLIPARRASRVDPNITLRAG